MSAVERIGNIFRIKDLRDRILFTIAIIVIYRIGTHIPIPGIDGKALGELFTRQLRGSFLGLYDLFVGGALSRASVLGIGIMPYISASIIFQLLVTVIPYLEKLQKEGEAGRRKITQYTRYATVLVAAIQSFGVSTLLTRFTSPSGLPIVPNPGPGFMITTILTLTAGAIFAMWLGEQITERGIGNGPSLLIFVGTLDTVPQEIASTIELIRTGALSIPMAILVLAVMFFITASVVFMTIAARKIPVQYARRIIGRRIYGGQTTHIPLRVITAGVIPIIFAQSIMIFPNTVASFMPKLKFAENFNQWFVPGHIFYDIPYALLIIFFTFYYTAIVLNPKDLAENLQRYGGFIPGIRPGDKTSEYIDKILKRITFPGSLYLAFVAIFPFYLIKWAHVPFYFGGTRLLIIVGVALDTLQQIESFLIMRQYEGLLKKGRIYGRRR
jgi:preprotein translocase subunit SecY